MLRTKFFLTLAFSLALVLVATSNVYGSYSYLKNQESDRDTSLQGGAQKGSKEEFLEQAYQDPNFNKAKKWIDGNTKRKFDLDEMVKKFTVQQVLISGTEIDFTKFMLFGRGVPLKIGKLLHPFVMEYFNLFYKAAYEASLESDDDEAGFTTAPSPTHKGSGTSEEETAHSSGDSGSNTPVKRKPHGETVED